MAQRHKSAVKRHRQNLKRAESNRVVRTHVRRAVRELRETIARKEADDAQRQLQGVMKTVHKAVTKGVLHRNNAARRIARLSSQVAALKQVS